MTLGTVVSSSTPPRARAGARWRRRADEPRRAVRLARLLAVATVALLASAELRIRVRDPSLALQGSADGQVYIQLAVFAVVGLLLLTRRLGSDLGRRWRRSPTRSLSPGSPLRLMRLVALAMLASSFWSPTSIAPVRAIQYVIAAELIIEVRNTCRGNREAIEAFWRVFVFGLALCVAVGAAVTLLPGGFDPFIRTYEHAQRFRLLEMHPIATSAVLGLTAVALWESVLRRHIAGNSAPFARPLRGGRRLAAAAAALLATVGVVLTYARINTLAAIAALLVLAVSARDRGRAQLVGILAVIVAMLTWLFYGAQLLSILTRRQTTSEISSLSGRDEIFQTADQLFRDQPLFGHGYLSGRSLFLSTIPWAGESHNVIVEIGVSFGLVGLLTLVVLIAYWWRSLRAGRRSGDDYRRLLAVRSVAIAVLVAVIAVASDGFAGPPGLSVMGLLIALLFAELAGAEEPDHLPTAPGVPANAGESPRIAAGTRRAPQVRRKPAPQAGGERQEDPVVT